MPTIWYEQGIRFSFYAGDRSEPPHVHAFKGSGHAKWWLGREEAREAYAKRLTRAERAAIRRIVLERRSHFLKEWEAYFREAR